MKRLLVLFVVLFTVFYSYTVVAQNWQIQNSNFPTDVFVSNFSSVNNQVCWAVGQKYPANTTPYAGYIRTTDGGNTWVCDTIPAITDSYLQEIFALDANTAYVTVYKLIETAGTSRGIYKTTDGGTTWNRQSAYNTSQSGPTFIHFFDSQNGLVVGDPNLESYTTTNGGLTWNPVTMPAALSDEYSWLGESRITVSGNNVWFVTTKARIFKSTDKGYTWSVILAEPQYSDWLPSIAFQNSQTGIYALKMAGNATDHIVRKTTNGGTTWSTISNPVLANLAPSTIQHIPGTTSNYILTAGRAATMKGTAVTYDAGESWTLLDTVGCFILNFVSYNGGWGSQWGTNVVYKYVGNPLPVELTLFTASANGTEVILNWSTVTEQNNYGFEIQRKAFDGDFATVAFVKGQGTTTQQNQYSFADKNLDEGKYFFRLKQVDFSGAFEYSKTIEVEVITVAFYSLEQNYPNPFNPTTTIGYVLQAKSNAKLTLLNSLGEEIAILVNEQQDKGYHKVEVDASKLSSGVYFYKLLTGEFTSVRKMLLLR